MSDESRRTGRQHRNALPKPRRRVGAPLIVATVLLAGLAVITIPNYVNAVQRGRQKRTMSDMRTIATAVESYSIRNNAYPVTTAPGGDAVTELAPLLAPTYVNELPLLDGWGHPFEVTSSTQDYTVTSRGRDGRPDAADGLGVGPNGQTSDFRKDVIFTTGSFVQYPDGTMS